MITGYNYIDGKFSKQADRNFFESINPATEEVIGQFQASTFDDVDEAVKAARKAFPAWKRLSRIKRAEYCSSLINTMYNMQDVITQAISKETGKSINESKAEFVEAIHMVEYTFAQGKQPYGTLIASEIAEKEIISFRKPKGVVAVISPFNFPFAIPFWCIAPALLEGNTVVLKQSEEVPYVGWLIASLFQEALFPAGVFNLIQGNGDVGACLVNSDIDHVCFTGSAKVGQYVKVKCAEAATKTCSCEMGSKSAVIVCDDADMDMAVNCCITSAYKLSGQRCVSAGRLIVHRSILKDFCDRFVAASKNLVIGDPLKDNVDFGPLINVDQLKRVENYNNMTRVDENVQVLLQGERLSRTGYFLSPHIYTCEWSDKAFLHEEVFGPHVAIIPFDDIQDAVEIYNDTVYGLSMACITKDMYKARYLRDNCDYGMAYLNLPCVGAASFLPFGGVKQSGNGSPSAAGTFKAVTHEVTWTANFQQDGFQMEQGLK